MSRRLRPARRTETEKKPPAPKLVQPTAADLHNPYGRYYTAPRSFEQLVQSRREKE